MTADPQLPTGTIHDQEVLIASENQAIWGVPTAPENLLGVALSGGGVRAAIVALGVLQTLASEDLLSKFHYLSTVSGGGYIGTALTWFWSSSRLAYERVSKADLPEFGSTPENFPFQDRSDPPSDAAPEAGPSAHEMAVKNLDFLRNHGSYLTTGDGIGIAGLVVAVVRTVLVSLLVWFPLLISIFMVIARVDNHYCPKGQDVCATLWVPGRPSFSFLLEFAAVLTCVFVLGVIFLALARPSEMALSGRKKWKALAIAFGCAVVAIVLAFVAMQVYQELANFQGLSGAFLVALIFGSTISTFFAIQPFLGKNPAYWTRRAFERTSSFSLPFFATCLIAGAIPLIVGYATNNPSTKTLSFAGFGISSSFLGTVSLLSGVGTALYGYYLKAKSVAPSLAGQLLALGSSILFIFGLLLFSFVVADVILSAELEIYQAVFCISIFAAALAIGTFSSINATGLHRFYRDRLMETFMPMTNGIEAGLARASSYADTLTIAEMWDGTKDVGRRPYHIINTHAILGSDPQPKLNVRGGDNFIISGAYIGSQATGWLSTEEYIERHGTLTVSSAMAASGAAATAHAGYIGTGLTRKRFISAVMSILNIRLGLWVGNPAVLSQHGIFKQRNATYFRPGLLSGIFGLGYKSGSRFLELSDGGHFENLGLYELVRRRVSVAVVVDAEQDETISLSSLVSAVNRIKEDFNTVIHFDEDRGPELLIGQESKQYPSGVQIARSPFIVGEIRYPDGSLGALVYIKSTMMTGLDFLTDGYRAANPDFPHQSTIDQFFQPAQFEAYRDLGRKSSLEAVRQLKLSQFIDKPQSIIDTFKAIWQPPVCNAHDCRSAKIS
ncbi:patatin-like phospholipase family protein [Rhizobium rhizogenes]|uniref:PNPLA domain-containing protein n=1 Tax=Rhizobium rhizogenes NBRC 13257 TaxID=1220581 RepID=A0AA87QBD9_RHIRH|nr:patatin-like phospholipase family protein [Rhizobium rhizogenes]NTG71236.1 hypothetical protein [Rhizobium rhizogenes]NTG90543.1 hypothetical protein [Rhizobium rhizogenes]TRB03362.1 hypothetical protein EXN67_28975 [Rhizobium rhizogenes]TRB38104.1 hypothetical protein EXN73_28540 [Rhizobium rhizogenes]TRB53115.1 hypothetical protein EXN71_28525 [Rhizobium rhizogenes]